MSPDRNEERLAKVGRWRRSLVMIDLAFEAFDAKDHERVIELLSPYDDGSLPPHVKARLRVALRRTGRDTRELP